MANIRLKDMEKLAGPIADSLIKKFKDGVKPVKILSGAAGFVSRHPVGVLYGLGGLGIASLALDLGNKLRGTHQIINESGKRQVMNYQTQILKDIAENIKKKDLLKTQDVAIPISPPLR